ncbi:MAG: c-type cytochrome [Caldilineaceae bacterium]|nr:c-type cytochrome [Caldilineaceae bacterium]
MNAFLARRLTWLAALLLAALLVLAACAPDASSLIISPGLGDQMRALEAGNEIVVAEPTAAPTLADLAPEQMTAGLPDDVLAALATADPAHGEQLALSNGCVGCHSLDPAVQMTGPTWYNVGNTAVSRVSGESPAYYLYLSIVQPNGFVVPNYPGNIMPATYGDLLSTQDLADLISYLLQQTQGATGS